MALDVDGRWPGSFLARRGGGIGTMGGRPAPGKRKVRGGQPAVSGSWRVAFQAKRERGLTCKAQPDGPAE
jgi:hypothetical protein